MQAAPSGGPDSARALDCGAADFYFGNSVGGARLQWRAASELRGSFANIDIAKGRTGWYPFLASFRREGVLAWQHSIRTLKNLQMTDYAAGHHAVPHQPMRRRSPIITTILGSAAIAIVAGMLLGQMNPRKAHAVPSHALLSRKS